jgi:DUF4097 and DUF4098 domain-containing protein YvlB
MKTKLILAGIALAFATSVVTLAQNSDRSWSKIYTVAGKPTLAFKASDAHIEIHSCGNCREIRVHVEVEGKKLNDYRLEESQAGDQVHFEFWPREHVGFYIAPRRSSAHITVETPESLILQAKTSDGSVTLTGLQGELGLTTGDGDVTLDHVSGNLRLTSGDGRVTITDAKGSLDARTSDASLSVDGVFHALTLHTSDGSVNLNLRQGTKLTEASSIQSSDGSVTVRLPEGFAADLNVHTSDGHVDCTLPLTMDHFSSKGDGNHEVHGRLNGGGTPLTIHTADGSVKIEQI